MFTEPVLRSYYKKAGRCYKRPSCLFRSPPTDCEEPECRTANRIVSSLWTYAGYLYRFNGDWNHGQRILSQPMLPREPLTAPLSFRSRNTVSEYMGLRLHQCSFDKTHLLLYNYRHSDLHTAFHYIEMLYCINHNAGLNRIQDDNLNIKTFFSCNLLHLYSIIQR